MRSLVKIAIHCALLFISTFSHADRFSELDEVQRKVEANAYFNKINFALMFGEPKDVYVWTLNYLSRLESTSAENNRRLAGVFLKHSSKSKPRKSLAMPALVNFFYSLKNVEVVFPSSLGSESEGFLGRQSNPPSLKDSILQTAIDRAIDIVVASGHFDIVARVARHPDQDPDLRDYLVFMLHLSTERLYGENSDLSFHIKQKIEKELGAATRSYRFFRASSCLKAFFKVFKFSSNPTPGVKTSL